MGAATGLPGRAQQIHELLNSMSPIMVVIAGPVAVRPPRIGSLLDHQPCDRRLQVVPGLRGRAPLGAAHRADRPRQHRQDQPLRRPHPGLPDPDGRLRGGHRLQPPAGRRCPPAPERARRAAPDRADDADHGAGPDARRERTGLGGAARTPGLRRPHGRAHRGGAAPDPAGRFGGADGHAPGAGPALAGAIRRYGRHTAMLRRLGPEAATRLDADLAALVPGPAPGPLTSAGADPATTPTH